VEPLIERDQVDSLELELADAAREFQRELA